MRDLIYSIDLAIFNFINQGLSNPFFDWLMPIFDNVKNWIPAILIMWILLCYFDVKNRKKMLILIPLVILVGDLVGKYIKHEGLFWICEHGIGSRDRPWFALGESINHLGGKGGRHFSFPSNHSLNMFSVFTVFSHYYQRYWGYLIGIASVVAFSRVYIGVHYPIDILIGAGMGITIGIVCYRLADRFIRSK